MIRRILMAIVVSVACGRPASGSDADELNSTRIRKADQQQGRGGAFARHPDVRLDAVGNDDA